MGEGGGVVGGVGVGGGGEGDGLSLEPVVGGKGQCGGAGQGAWGGDGGGQRHVLVGAGGQTHGVGGHGDFLHGECRRLDEDLGCRINRDEDVECGGLAVCVLDCVPRGSVATVGVAVCSRRGGGGPGHDTGGGREGQAWEECLEWLSVPEAVRQGAVAVDGGWQRQSGNGGADGVDLAGHHDLAEDRVALGIGDGDDDGSHVVGIAGDRMGKGDAFAVGVVVQAGGDGDGLCQVPDVGGEDQGTGDDHGAVGGIDDGGHGHVVGGGGIEGHGVDGGGAFVHGEGGGGRNDAGSGLDGPHFEAGGLWRAEAGVAKPGVGEGDGGWGGRGRAEGVAGTIAGGDGGRAALAIDGPVDHDGKRGGLQDACLDPAVSHLHGIHPQCIGGIGIQDQNDLKQVPCAVKQACREGGVEQVAVELHGGEPWHIEDPCGQGGERLEAQLDRQPADQTTQRPASPAEDVDGQGLQHAPGVQIQVASQIQGRQRVHPGEEAAGQGGERVHIQSQLTHVGQPGEDTPRQGGEAIVVEIQDLQTGSVCAAHSVEDVHGQAGELVVVQAQGLQTGQSSEYALGQALESVASQGQGLQAQPAEVSGLESEEVHLSCHTQGLDAG